ncbi:malonate decarboxylase holo-ACP synthase [Priestia abyssalis]|uniref:malonate decarboxylase holo-ACP synthase n=1 Tax=Priestia abyssalis TaxID=1221450 RepID=UPI00099509F9|nr:malonate decarboxylase holo-ACP synthase [Priestia abyssalis]
MDIKAHDLLHLNNISSLITERPEPKWVHESLTLAPFAVVLRAPIKNGNIPVGIRGSSRSERFAAFILEESIIEHITPENLVAQKVWRQSPRQHEVHALGCLDRVDEILQFYQLPWGPGGSVGFELASGRATVTVASDLDIVVRPPSFLSLEKAERILHEFSTLPVRVDAQIETPSGAISLIEYARGESQLLLRTMDGPRLVKDPWEKGYR